MTTYSSEPDDIEMVKLTVDPSFEKQLPDEMFPVGRGDVPTWHSATKSFIDIRKEEEDAATTRFTDTWRNTIWNRLYNKHEEACFDKCTHFALLVFSGDYTIPGTDKRLPPLEYFQHLQAAKEARKKRLDRLLDDHNAASYRIRAIGSDPRIGPRLQEPLQFEYNGELDTKLKSYDHSKHGYPRLFLGIYMSEDIRARELYQVIESHRNNCKIASDTESIGADRVNETVIKKHVWKYDGRMQAKDAESKNPIKMLGRRIPTLADTSQPINNLPIHRQKTATMIEAGGWEPLRISHADYREE